MNRLHVCILLSVFAVVVARAEGTNAPSTAAATSNSAPTTITSNALPASITIDGISYQDVRWSRLTPSTVTIFHKTGVATIPLWNLPTDLQRHFGYNSEKAQAYEADQSKREADQSKREAERVERLRKQKGLEERIKSAQPVLAEIGQVLETGVLVNVIWENRWPREWSSQELFVDSLPDLTKVVVGGQANWMVYDSGIYKFTSTDGAPMQVARWSYCGTWHWKYAGQGMSIPEADK